MYLYSIKVIRSNRELTVRKKYEEFVVSPGLEEVLEYLKLDRQDQGVEIEGIVRLVPVLKVLKGPSTE